MRVLLDSNLPRGLAALLPGHRTDTTHQRRWSDLDDGPLLAVAAKEYDAFITMDQSIRYQQNLSRGITPNTILRLAKLGDFARGMDEHATTPRAVPCTARGVSHPVPDQACENRLDIARDRQALLCISCDSEE